MLKALILRLLMAFVLLVFLFPSSIAASETTSPSLDMTRLPFMEEVTLTSGTKVTVLREGTGKVPAADRKLLLHYQLTMNGQVTDSSRTRLVPAPFEVELGRTNLVPGFTAALEGMRIGEIRKAVVPPDQGYGVDGNPTLGIPANTTLIFEIELVGTRALSPAE